MRDLIGGMTAFLAVADKRSFRAAADELGVTGSAVSQTIRQVEEELGVQLLTRTTRSVALTEAGEHLRRGLAPAFAEVRATLASLDELRRRPAGTLRLNVSSIAESFLSEALLAEFLAQYPDVKLEVAIDAGTSDLVQEGFDAGVQLGEVIAQDMIAVAVSGDQRQIVVASPAYLKRRGRPEHPRDLTRHDCIGWRRLGAGAPYRWEFSDRGKDLEVAIDARVNTNEMRLMLRLACDGVGLTIGMEDTFRPYIARGELVPVLERYCPSFPGFFLYYPSRTQVPAKLRALVDFLKARRRKKR